MSYSSRRQPLIDLNASRQMEAQNGKKFNSLVNDTLSRLENLQSLLTKPQNVFQVEEFSENSENVIQIRNEPLLSKSDSPVPKNQNVSETQRPSETIESDHSPDNGNNENVKRKAKKARRNAKKKEQREVSVIDENSTPLRNDHIKLDSYKNESQIGVIMELIGKELSEPYSIYTYRYFINTWPELTLIAYDTQLEKYVGVIVCKVDSPKIETANEDEEQSSKGYIAMLAVDESHRRLGIGTQLVEEVIARMHKMGCDEIILETEISNTKALTLYSRLGFIRERRLFRYYLNGSDAFRLISYRS